MTVPFPANPLGIKVELDVNGIWTDISQYVYQRDDIQISSIGQPDETSSIQAGQCRLTLNNRDGRFSPKNTSGAYYPYVVRNAQMRVSINAESSNSTVYSGYRFWGEVSEWPPTSDITGNDVYVQVTISGIWRRLSRSQESTIGSAYYRYMKHLTTGDIPIVYYPTEDGSGATSFPVYFKSAGTGSAGTWTGTPSLAACTDFPGSDALPQFNNAVFTFSGFSGGGTAVMNCARFALSVPAAGDAGQVGTNWNLAHITTAGTVATLDVYLMANNTLQIQGLSSGGSTLFTGSLTTNMKGTPVLVTVEMTSGAWALKIIKPGAGSILETVTGSHSQTVGAVTSVQFNRSGKLQDTAAGQLSVHYDSPSITDAAAALGGYAGETAIARFERICTEEGISYEVVGSSSVAMGPQYDDTLANLLQTIPNSDCGLLYETRDQFGLGYRAYESMVDQSAVLTLDYSAKVLAATPQTIYDDQYSHNDVTINNYDGFTYRLQLASGAMSILPPPNGMGSYPGNPVSVSLSSATESSVALSVAERILFPGVVDELRVPQLVLDLTRTQVASLFSAIPSVWIGDYIEITNPPSWLTPTATKQLAFGYSENLSAFKWTITFNVVPELAYESTFNPGTTVGGQATGSAVTGGQSGSNAVTAAQIGPGAITPPMLSTAITALSLGGITTTISPSAPASPNVGDIWINSSAGYQLNQWNGSSWTAITFNGTNVLAAGSVTATEIANATITGTQIAAATIVGANIAAGAITSGNISANAITAGLIAAGAINGQSITAASIGASSIVAGSITSSTIESTSYILDDQSDGTILVYAQTNTSTTYTSGSGNWSCPAGTLYARVQCWGGGAGGGAAETGGGGGGEYAEESQLAVTPGNSYAYSVGAGGAGSTGSPNASGAGGNSTFAGDSVTVTANGAPAVAFQGFGGGNGAGGSGSANTIHFNGGSGGAATNSAPGGGGGGGSSAGTMASGRNGANASGTSGAAGGIAPSGGGSGGHGGSSTNSGITAGSVPGGGGGGAGAPSSGPQLAADAGAAGKVIVTAVKLVLIASIAAVAGSDSYGNAYPAQLNAGMYTLIGGSTPFAPASGKGLLYATSNGTPSAELPSALAGQLPVTQADTSTNTLGNTTTDTPISKAWSIPANDAKAGTEYVIDLPFTGVHEGQILNFGIQFNGSGFTNICPLGGAAFTSGHNTAGTIRLHVQCITTGSLGTANLWTEGTIVDASVNRGSATNTVATLDGFVSAASFNTTVSNTIAVAAGYAATATGQTTTGHGSTFTRKGP